MRGKDRLCPSCDLEDHTLLASLKSDHASHFRRYHDAHQKMVFVGGPQITPVASDAHFQPTAPSWTIFHSPS
eukprot:scaffold63405_cov17-Tisochrysis_lutea.AAC.4